MAGFEQMGRSLTTSVTFACFRHNGCLEASSGHCGKSDT